MQDGLRALFDRDILEFFLIGMILFGIGLLGEYVGRIYQEVRRRPRYLVEAVLEQSDQADAAPATVAPIDAGARRASG